MNRRVLFLACLIGYGLAGSTAIVLGAASLVWVVPLRIGLPAIGAAFVIGFAVVVALALLGPTDPIDMDGDGA